MTNFKIDIYYDFQSRLLEQLLDQILMFVLYFQENNDNISTKI